MAAPSSQPRDYLGLDMTTATRQQYVTTLTTQPTPSFTSSKSTLYVAYRTHLDRLLTLLTSHTAMSRNISQPYSQPANSKNKVYFMWDFVGRTLGYLIGVGKIVEEGVGQWDAKGNAKGNDQVKEMWEDMQGRCVMAVMLITDREGQLDMMMSMTHPGGGTENAEFGEEILKVAGDLGRVK